MTSRHNTVRTAPSIGVVALAGLLASCSIGDSFDGVAAETIEGRLADALVIEFTDAECDEPANEDVGTRFGCTATIPDVGTARFDAEIVSDDEVLVTPVDVFGPEDFELVESDAPVVVGDAAGVEVVGVDCPNQGVLLVDGSTTCEITGPDGTFELIVSLDAAAERLVYDIGDQIR